LWREKFVYTPTKARPFQMDGLLALGLPTLVGKQLAVGSKDKSIESKAFRSFAFSLLLLLIFILNLTSDICFFRFFRPITYNNEFSAAPFLRLFIPFRLSAKPKIRKLASLKQSGFITV